MRRKRLTIKVSFTGLRYSGPEISKQTNKMSEGSAGRFLEQHLGQHFNIVTLQVSVHFTPHLLTLINGLWKLNTEHKTLNTGL